jgi:hypothetical protein
VAVRPVALLFLFLFCLILPARAGYAQASIERPQVEYVFGEHITFHAMIESDVPVEEAVVLFDAEGDPRSESGVATMSPEGELTYRFELANHPLRTFSDVSYRFRLSLAGGEVTTSPNYTFRYEDNRFDWQTLEAPPFVFHWYEGDIAFAQGGLDVAQEGLERIQSLIDVEAPQEHVDIYAYASAGELQVALNPAEDPLVAAHADPELGVVMVALQSGADQRVLMEERIPHELMHVMLAQNLGPEYHNLPAWYKEGLASISELYPNPDYQILLENAYNKNILLSVESLCQAFPQDASNALLAYAQSASFTRHLHRSFGATGLQTLANNYADGLDCVRGFESSFDHSLIQAERQWRQSTFSENVNATALNNLLPWLVMLLVVVGAPILLMLLSLKKSS